MQLWAAPHFGDSRFKDTPSPVSRKGENVLNPAVRSLGRSLCWLLSQPMYFLEDCPKTLLGAPGTARGRAGAPGGAWERLEAPRTAWERRGTLGSAGERLATPANAWERLEAPGSAWERLELLGAPGFAWERLGMLGN
eukprot:1832297-Pyramimonas_sp.AAC.1